MNTLKLCLCISLAVRVLLVDTVPAKAQQPSPSDSAALRLVDAMQVEQMVKAALEATVRKNLESQRATMRELECIQSVDVSASKTIYARQIARVLTKNEIEDAVAFFTSEAGRSYVRYAQAMDMAAHGMPAESAELTESEVQIIRRFVASRAGKKLLQDKAHETRELRQAIQKQLGPVIAKCRGA